MDRFTEDRWDGFQLVKRCCTPGSREQRQVLYFSLVVPPVFSYSTTSITLLRSFSSIVFSPPRLYHSFRATDLFYDTFVSSWAHYQVPAWYLVRSFSRVTFVVPLSKEERSRGSIYESWRYCGASSVVICLRRVIMVGLLHP